MDETKALKPTTAPFAKSGQLAPLTGIDPKQVLERYLAEESTADIAQSLGVTRSGLNYWLLRTAEDEWKNAQVVRALKRKQEAEDELDSAADAFTLARARERLRAAQWDLERVCRRIYGQDVQVEDFGRVSITLNIGVQSQQSGQGETLAGQVIDSTSELT
jgi:hypothetical protein